jgi:hypothetical protein
MPDGSVPAGALNEAERQIIREKMMVIFQRLETMIAAAPAVTEPAHQWIKEQCADPMLSKEKEFKEIRDKVLAKARAVNCDAHMRATNDALTEAARLATEGKMTERGGKLVEAQAFYGRACRLGANEHFRRATGRLIETVMMTGGKRRAGPAKPDSAPKEGPGTVRA